MTPRTRYMAGAFAAMLFVGVFWGVNLPVTKVMLGHFDLFPLAALRTIVAVLVLAAILALVEGVRALRIDLDLRRFALLGLMMGTFFCVYALGVQFSNPITASAVQVAGPLVSAVTVRFMTGARFDPGFRTALALTLLGGAILASSSFSGSANITFGGGEIVVLLSNVLWTVYSLKVQAWFAAASQLHRTYVASVSVMLWMTALSVALVMLGISRSPFLITDAWIWTQFLSVAALASGLGSYCWNIGASRMGVAIASLWVNMVPFFSVLWSMAYGFVPNAYQIVGGLVALSGVVYMQWRKLGEASHA